MKLLLEYDGFEDFKEIVSGDEVELTAQIGGRDLRLIGEYRTIEINVKARAIEVDVGKLEPAGVIHNGTGVERCGNCGSVLCI